LPRSYELRLKKLPIVMRYVGLHTKADIFSTMQNNDVRSEGVDCFVGTGVSAKVKKLTIFGNCLKSIQSPPPRDFFSKFCMHIASIDHAKDIYFVPPR